MKKEIIKPSFDLEVKAEIKGIPQIEDNIEKVKEIAIATKEYYSTVVFTEEVMNEAKNEKAEINKFKSKVAGFRKSIMEEYKLPIANFEKTAKETESILSDTYDVINVQVAEYETKIKEEKREEIKSYFEEYAASKNIDFVGYEKLNQNVTLSASMKSLKEEVATFIDKVVEDLNLIETQEHKAEILAEYKNNLNVAQSINDVVARKKAIEEEKERLELREKLKAREAEQTAELEKVNKIEAPEVVTVQEEQEQSEEEFTMTFTVTATKEKLIELKKLLKERGYINE